MALETRYSLRDPGPGWQTELAEIRAEQTEAGTRLSGYACVFDADSARIPTARGSFVERVARGAIELRPDVLATVDHTPRASAMLGRTSSGTLRLSIDDRGLAYAVDVPDTQAGRDVRELIRRNDVRGSSFMFKTVSQRWERDRNGVRRRILDRVVVYELGPVVDPAYPDTTVAMRSLGEAGQQIGEFGGGRLGHMRRRLDLVEWSIGD